MNMMEQQRPTKIRRIKTTSRQLTKIPLEMISCSSEDRIYFDGITLSSNSPPMRTFIENQRVFSSIVLENITLAADHHLFWKKLGNNFTELIFNNCFIPAQDLIFILKNMKKLTKIVIFNSRNLCKALFTEIERGNKDLFTSSSLLTSFIIDESWNGIGSRLFAKWLSNMPNITEFEILLIDEDLFLVECLKLWVDNLTTLRIKNKICAETINRIFELKMLRLEVFHIGSKDKVNGNTLIEFISKQKNLLELTLGINGVDENLLERITHIATNLKVLVIYNTEDLCVIRNSEVLQFLGKIKRLSLSVQSYNVLDQFLNIPNKNLTHLVYDQAIEEDEDREFGRFNDIAFENMTGFVNLTFLSVIDDYICGVDIQNIIKHLKGLEVLKVNTKQTLSDFAFNGKGSQYPKKLVKSEYNEKGNCTGPFYQLSRLKNLIELDVQSGDNKFTDLALDCISKCKKLKIVNLTNYKKITISGIAQMIESCLHLETIYSHQKIQDEISNYFDNRVIKICFKK